MKIVRGSRHFDQKPVPFQFLLLVGLIVSSFVYINHDHTNAQLSSPVDELWISGPRETSINIAFLAEGYRSEELDQFVLDAQKVIDYLVGTTPFHEYQNYFNAFAVRVASAESGSDHPLLDIEKNTYFNSTYSSYGLAQTLTIPPNDRDSDPANGYGKAHQLLSGVLPEWDLIVILVNDPAYGGWGDRRGAISSVHPSMPEVIAHEFAHTFAGLGDEYETPFPQDPEPVIEEPNTTQKTNREDLKWKDWISPQTPIPTPESHSYSEVIGLFEGARYHASNWYRPRFNCRMRNLYTPFCEVCREALIRAVYRFTPPIAGVTPDLNEFEVEEGTPLEFNVQPHEPLFHSLAVRWSLNGEWLAEDKDQPGTLHLENLPPGIHEIEAVVSDPTPWVLNDPEDLLKQTITWTVMIIPSGNMPAPFYVPVYQHEGSGFTGVAIMNQHQQGVSLMSRPLGIEVPEPPSLLIPGNSQLARLAREILNLDPGTRVRGFIGLQNEELPLGAYFMIGDGENLLDGSAPLSPLSSTFYFTRVSEGADSFHNQPARTIFGLGNPGEEEAHVSFELYGDGMPAQFHAQVDIPIPPQTSFFASLSEIFGSEVDIENGFLKARLVEGPAILATGMIEVNQNTLMILRPHMAGPGSNLRSAQLASGRFADQQGIFTELRLLNSASEERTLTVRTFAEDGAPLAPDYLLSILGRSSRTVDAEELLDGHIEPNAPVVGSIEILSDGFGVLGDLFFGDAASATFATSLPLQEEAFNEAIFPHIATVQGLFTGLAFLNPGLEPCQIEISVFEPDGKMVGTASLSLPSFGRISQLVTELIPEAQGQDGGFVRIQASHPIIAQQLFGDAELEYLAAVTPLATE